MAFEFVLHVCLKFMNKHSLKHARICSWNQPALSPRKQPESSNWQVSTDNESRCANHCHTTPQILTNESSLAKGNNMSFWLGFELTPDRQPHDYKSEVLPLHHVAPLTISSYDKSIKEHINNTLDLHLLCIAFQMPFMFHYNSVHIHFMVIHKGRSIIIVADIVSPSGSLSGK